MSYNIFKEEKNLVLETINSRKTKIRERNNSINYFNLLVRHDETLNIENNALKNDEVDHRKFYLDKRIRDFKNKITNDLSSNKNFENFKADDSKKLFSSFMISYKY